MFVTSHQKAVRPAGAPLFVCPSGEVKVGPARLLFCAPFP